VNIGLTGVALSPPFSYTIDTTGIAEMVLLSGDLSVTVSSGELSAEISTGVTTMNLNTGYFNLTMNTGFQDFDVVEVLNAE
jgi:hypothetical protein